MNTPGLFSLDESQPIPYHPCDIPAGEWEIQWHTPHPPQRRPMLDLWIRLDHWRRETFPQKKRFRVWIQPDSESSFYDAAGDELRIVLPDKADVAALRASLKPLFMPALQMPLLSGRRILLAVPVISGDKRWESIGITASDLILGSSLNRNGWRVSITHPLFPAGPSREMLDHCDILGISLCEDLFPALRTWERAQEGILPPWIAVGGPMVTLTPLPAAAHFPAGNIWIRGEGEGLFPRVLHALASKDSGILRNSDGVLVVRPGLLLAWNFERINRPGLPVEDDYDFSFVSPDEWRKGIEINLSRGCRRTCVFCSRVQGTVLRRTPEKAVTRMLRRMREAMPSSNENRAAGTLNINDDDILQDVDYAAKILEHIRREGFRLWGIQTSIASALENGKPRREVIDLLSRREYYVGDPLVWFGTDAFLPRRGKILAKLVPDTSLMEQLFAQLQTHEIRHMHYWIISDHLSGWLELTEELRLVSRWRHVFPHFDILPHSPFLIPYPSTPLFNWLSQSSYRQQIRVREWLRSEIPCLNYPLVTRVESRFEMLNMMLSGHPDGHNPPFLDSLNRHDHLAAFETAHYFLRQERLRLGNSPEPQAATGNELEKAQEELEAAILEYRAKEHTKRSSFSVRAT
ncbi:MAG: hypothetical protein RB296_06610 [Acidobacteriota bacterium]|jgi:hypothetical protein|nr:hypothetical protein [Acidobacteriota bacterium]